VQRAQGHTSSESHQNLSRNLPAVSVKFQLDSRNAEEDKTVHRKITDLWRRKKVELCQTQLAINAFGGLVVFFEFLRRPVLVVEILGARIVLVARVGCAHRAPAALADAQSGFGMRRRSGTGRPWSSSQAPLLHVMQHFLLVPFSLAQGDALRAIRYA
jgi:hypothetical protein